MWTAMPPTSSPMTSHSPVCRPTRTSRSRSRRAATIASAQRTACDGAPSKAMRNASPIVLTSRPPKRSISRRTAVWWAASRARQRARAPAGEELLDLAQQVGAVDRARQVVDSLELDEARARDVLRQVARVAYVDQAIAGAMHDQGGDAQLAQQVGDVVVAHRVHERQQLAGAR